MSAPAGRPVIVMSGPARFSEGRMYCDPFPKNDMDPREGTEGDDLILSLMVFVFDSARPSGERDDTVTRGGIFTE